MLAGLAWLASLKGNAPAQQSLDSAPLNRAQSVITRPLFLAPPIEATTDAAHSNRIASTSESQLVDAPANAATREELLPPAKLRRYPLEIQRLPPTDSDDSDSKSTRHDVEKNEDRPTTEKGTKNRNEKSESKAREALFPDGSDTNQPTYPITLDEAIFRSLSESAEIHVRRQDIAVAYEEMDIAKSVFDPLLYWNYNQQYGRRPSVFQTDRPTDDHATANAEFQILKHTVWGTRVDLSGLWVHSHENDSGKLLNPLDDSKLSFTITQPLLKGAGMFFNTAPIYLASRFTDITSLRFERIVTTVMRETEVIYWEFHFRYENWRDQRRTYETAKKLQDFAQAKFDVGLYSELDFERAQSALALRLVKLTEARNAATVTENKLKGITNAGQSRSGPTIKWQPSEVPEIMKPSFRIEEEICRGFQHRPDFQAAVLDLENQEIRIDVHENALLPVVNIETGVSSVALAGGDSGEVDGNGNRLISPYVGDLGNMFEHMFWRDGVVWNIGVIVQFPFYRREASAALRQRHAIAKQAFARLVRAERSIIREVREAIEIIETTYIKVEQAKRNRALTESIYDRTMIQMQNGFTDVKRVVDALDQVAEARILENRVVAEYLNALTQLEQATGTYLQNRGVLLDRMGNVTLNDIANNATLQSPPGQSNVYHGPADSLRASHVVSDKTAFDTVDTPTSDSLRRGNPLEPSALSSPTTPFQTSAEYGPQPRNSDTQSPLEVFPVNQSNVHERPLNYAQRFYSTEAQPTTKRRRLNFLRR